MMQTAIPNVLSTYYDQPSLSEGYRSIEARSRSIHVDNVTFSALEHAFTCIPAAQLDTDFAWPSSPTEIILDEPAWTEHASQGAMLARLRRFAFERIALNANRENALAEIAFYEMHEAYYAGRDKPAELFTAGVARIDDDGSIQTHEFPHVSRPHPDFALALNLISSRLASQVAIDRAHRLRLLNVALATLWLLRHTLVELRPEVGETAGATTNHSFFDRPHFRATLSSASVERLSQAAVAYRHAADPILSLSLRGLN